VFASSLLWLPKEVVMLIIASSYRGHFGRR
jgi:hypothetical protein